MVGGKENPRSPVGSPPNGCVAVELLQAGQYDQVATILHARWMASKGGGAVRDHILDAARRICLACAQCHEQVAWHRRALQEVEQRERELQQQLYTILTLLDESGAFESETERETPSAPPVVEAVPSVRDLTDPKVRHNLWQHIQGWLRRKPAPRPPEPESPIPPAEAPPLSPVEQVQVPAVPPPEPEREGTIEKEVRGERAPPSLMIYCLGPFRVYQDDELITDWPSGKGRAIFKYMMANRARPFPKEVLMDLFWRDSDPEAARNNLNVALYGLRKALRATRPDFDHILFQDDHYLLNSTMDIWVDAEEFMRHYDAGQDLERKGMLAEAVSEYEVAEGLYQGDLFEEDLYEDWPMLQREGLKDSYLVILDRLSRRYLEEKRHAACIHLCQRILAKDDCREDAHRRLMRCYSRQGQRNLALRQYHLCVETLARVLEVPPMPETIALYQQIHNGAAV